MHKFLKNILLISISIVLLTSVLIVGVLWTYSNDIPDYKFLKNYKPPVKRTIAIEIRRIFFKNLCILIPLYL